MKLFATLFALISAIAFIVSIGRLAGFGQTSERTIGNQFVVVELFTSEGCSSCPPADEMFRRLDETRTFGNVDVIVLAEHVDYWNYSGWTDRFSSKAFTERQKQYAQKLNLTSVYTPQVVIDGAIEGIGNDSREMREKLGKAAKTPRPAEVLLQWGTGNSLRVGVAYRGSGSPAVLLAVTEAGTGTIVDGGENEGRTLNHAPVVRVMKSLGRIDRGRLMVSVSAPVHRDWERENLRAVVFVQDPETLHILGAAQVPYH